MNTVTVSAIGASLLSCSFSIVSASTQCNDHYCISVSLNESSLAISIKNVSSGELHYSYDRLPWGNRYSMIVVLAEKRSPNGTLSSPFYIDDPAFRPQSLLPNQSVSGQINLTGRFVEFDESGSYILFWSYEMMPSDGAGLGRMSGNLLFEH